MWWNCFPQSEKLIANVSEQMADMRENVENEVHAARDEYLKMEAHIRLYVTEMEQSI